MYKVGTMPAAPAGQGGSEGEGSRCPSLRQPSRCPLAQAGRAAPASRPCRDGVPRLGVWPHPPCHAPLCPPPCAGAMGGGDPPPRPPGLAVRSPCSGQWSLLSGSTPLLWHHGPSPVHPGGHRGLRWRKTGLRDGHDGCQEGSWVAPSPGSAAKGAREVHGPLRGVSGSSAHMRALTLTAALGAAGVVPPGRACTGGRWAFLALAVCLPRLQGRKRG